MQAPRYTTLITDIDGTLVAHRADLHSLAEADAFIPASTVDAIKRLQSAGVNVASITGRTYDQSRELLVSLGITGPCVFAGGAAVRNLPDGEILYEASMEPPIVKMVCESLRDILGKDHALELAPSASNPSRHNSIWTYVDDDRLDEVMMMLATVDGIYYAATPRKHTGKSGLVVLHGDVSKASGVRHLLSLLGLDREEVACIGDGLNDIPMFEECGLRIAMGNSDEALKKHADHVVADIAQDGFAEGANYILQAVPTF